MRVKIVKKHPDAIVPKYATVGSSGFDLHALEDITILPNQTVLISTGLCFEVPLGYEMQIRPRSGMSLKTNFRICNSPGTVDSDFSGVVQIIGQNTAHTITYFESPTTQEFVNNVIYIKKGDRIAQGVICPVVRVEFEEVKDLTGTERAEGGFGSTGA